MHEHCANLVKGHLESLIFYHASRQSELCLGGALLRDSRKCPAALKCVWSFPSCHRYHPNSVSLNFIAHWHCQFLCTPAGVSGMDGCQPGHDVHRCRQIRQIARACAIVFFKGIRAPQAGSQRSMASFMLIRLQFFRHHKAGITHSYSSWPGTAEELYRQFTRAVVLDFA